MKIEALTKIAEDVYARVDSLLVVHNLYRPNQLDECFATAEQFTTTESGTFWMIVPMHGLPKRMPPAMVAKLEEARDALKASAPTTSA
jgi:hypothetical protein